MNHRPKLWRNNRQLPSRVRLAPCLVLLAIMLISQVKSLFVSLVHGNGGTDYGQLLKQYERPTTIPSAADNVARVEEHRKSFAVVATAVRKLVERNQQAAQHINSLTSSSVVVGQGSGTLLNELVPSIRKTTELVQAVATASREQASGVSQMNRALSQGNQGTQRNAAAAVELSSTAEDMADHADGLQHLVGFFKVAATKTPIESQPDGRADGKSSQQRRQQGVAKLAAARENWTLAAARHQQADENFRQSQ